MNLTRLAEKIKSPLVLYALSSLASSSLPETICQRPCPCDDCGFLIPRQLPPIRSREDHGLLAPLSCILLLISTQFMHNGGIEQFSKIKRRLQQQLPDEIFNVVNGNTDSEWSFALFLSKVCHLQPFLPHTGTLMKESKAS